MPSSQRNRIARIEILVGLVPSGAITRSDAERGLVAAGSATATGGDRRRRMLDERDDAVGHEPARADRRPGAGHLGDLDDAAAGRDLDAATGLRRLDLVLQRPVARVDDDLDPLALHARRLPPGTDVRG